MDAKLILKASCPNCTGCPICGEPIPPGNNGVFLTAPGGVQIGPGTNVVNGRIVCKRHLPPQIVLETFNGRQLSIALGETWALIEDRWRKKSAAVPASDDGAVLTTPNVIVGNVLAAGVAPTPVLQQVPAERAERPEPAPGHWLVSALRAFRGFLFPRRRRRRDLDPSTGEKGAAMT
jgi:hypothetical protein